MQRPLIEPRWNVIYGWGAVLLAVFILIQIIPSTMGSLSSDEYDVIEKSEAESSASRFIQESFGESIASAAAVHQSQRVFYGYLAKEKLIDAYEKQYGDDYPTDTYQVEVRSTTTADRFERVRFVHVHMKTGEVIAWNEVKAGPERVEEDLPFSAASLAAVAFASEKGLRKEELQVRGLPERDGAVVIDVAGAKIGEAKLAIRVRAKELPSGEVSIVEYKPSFEAPERYTSYVTRQDQISGILTFVGYLGMTFVLFVLSIVYAALTRKHTSFLRGLLLTGLFLVFYCINNVNIYDGIRASFGEVAGARAMTDFGIALQMGFTVAMAASVYFALVGGDGLWRQMGRNLWVRRGEQGFGEHTWRAMKIGYWAAFIFLGLQSIILIVLERGFGTWATSDVTQSPLNFGYAWIFPLLAWCAAISEEAVYRLFGIAIFRKWFKNSVLASIIPTIVWAFGHVAYPIYPWNTRLIELTLLGLLFCYLFLKFGFAAAVFTHAIIDSILMSLSLVFLGGALNIIAGIVYVILPVGIAWAIRYWDRTRPLRSGGHRVQY
jgi:hypothetical protein